jgi:DNA invertase Pin-like site-specific DNA recombinase
MGYSAVWAVFLVSFLLHAWNGVLDREDVSKQKAMIHRFAEAEGFEIVQTFV